MPEQLEALYEAYLNEFRRMEQGRRPFEGVFGLGGGPQSYPCHSKFAEDLERLLKDFAAQAPSSGQVGQVLSYIYFTAPVRWKAEPAVDWMLLAVHGLTQELIPLLDAGDAQPLRDTYQDVYPRRSRLPVQTKLFAALQKRCKADR